MSDRRLVDGALVLAGLVLTVFAVKAPWSVLPQPVIAVAGTVGSLAQWYRRRWPAAATVAGAVAFPLSGNPGPAVVGLHSGASYAPRRRVWILAVVGWAGFAGWSWIDRGQLAGTDLWYTAFIAALVVGVGVYAATRRELAASWRERAERAEAERQLREDQARTAERTRIAQEMHDVVAHKVSLIALHAGALELAAHAGPEQVQQTAALIRVTSREALQELRYVLGVLRAERGPGTPDGTFADLPSLIQASARAGQQVELHDRAGPLPPATARVVYRIAQEGLTNARKHSPDVATDVSVDRGDDGTVTVTVRNAPTGDVPMDLPGSGAGLVGLAERIRLVGGTIHSGPLGRDGGWQLRAVVPWLDPGREAAS